MSIPKLFQERRACVVCGQDARRLARAPLPGEPRILAVSMTVYRKGEGKSALKAAPAVRVCEGCMIRAIAGGFFGAGSAGSKVWAALRSSLSTGYSALIAEDK
jgi:hypothetical protein